jgi:hypothetical protein
MARRARRSRVAWAGAAVVAAVLALALSRGHGARAAMAGSRGASALGVPAAPRAGTCSACPAAMHLRGGKQRAGRAPGGAGGANPPGGGDAVRLGYSADEFAALSREVTQQVRGKVDAQMAQESREEEEARRKTRNKKKKRLRKNQVSRCSCPLPPARVRVQRGAHAQAQTDACAPAYCPLR